MSRSHVYGAIAVSLIGIALAAFLIGRATGSDSSSENTTPAGAAEPQEQSVRGLSSTPGLPDLEQGADEASSATTPAETDTSSSSSTPSSPAPSTDSGNTGDTTEPEPEPIGGGTD